MDYYLGIPLSVALSTTATRDCPLCKVGLFHKGNPWFSECPWNTNQVRNCNCTVLLLVLLKVRFYRFFFIPVGREDSLQLLCSIDFFYTSGHSLGVHGYSYNFQALHSSGSQQMCYKHTVFEFHKERPHVHVL